MRLLKQLSVTPVSPQRLNAHRQQFERAVQVRKASEVCLHEACAMGKLLAHLSEEELRRLKKETALSTASSPMRKLLLTILSGKDLRHHLPAILDPLDNSLALASQLRRVRVKLEGKLSHR